jgi:NADH:ubiquinone oxidoreductase subunit H
MDDIFVFFMFSSMNLEISSSLAFSRGGSLLSFQHTRILFSFPSTRFDRTLAVPMRVCLPLALFMFLILSRFLS